MTAVVMTLSLTAAALVSACDGEPQVASTPGSLEDRTSTRARMPMPTNGPTPTETVGPAVAIASGESRSGGERAARTWRP